MCMFVTIMREYINMSNKTKHTKSLKIRHTTQKTKD